MKMIINDELKRAYINEVRKLIRWWRRLTTGCPLAIGERFATILRFDKARCPGAPVVGNLYTYEAKSYDGVPALYGDLRGGWRTWWVECIDWRPLPRAEMTEELVKELSGGKWSREAFQKSLDRQYGPQHDDFVLVRFERVRRVR